MNFTKLFLIIGLLYSTLVSSLAFAQMDQDDRLCADFMVKTFHAYSQYTQNEPIDFCKESVADKLPALQWINGARESLQGIGIPIYVQYLASPPEQWASWTIQPLKAKTGIKWWNQACAACSASEWGSEDLIGLIGFNPVEKKIVVAFRGTQQPREWIGNNFNLIPGKITPGAQGLGLKGIPVHRGYWEIISQLIPALEKQVRDYLQDLSLEDRSGYHIYFTGHSLGGALATLAATALSEQLSDLLPHGLDLRSFAAPAVGGEKFKTKFLDLIQEKHLSAKSIVRDIDPVPNAIPAWLGYQQPIIAEVFKSTNEEKLNCKSFDCRHDVRHYHRLVHMELGLGDSYVPPIRK